MLLYRSLVLGIVGAIILLEVARPTPAPRLRPLIEMAPVAPTLVDVSRQALDVAAVDPAPVIGLRPGERIARVDETPVVDGAAAFGARLRSARAGDFLDLDVRRGERARRVLVLVH
jgi:hypothetical protein